MTRCSSPAIPATVAVGASSMRRPSTILARRADASLSVRDAHPPFLLPFLLPRTCVEPGRARAAAELCADQLSPPRPVSSRQSLPHLTPHLCSTSPTSFGPSPGRNRAADRRRHCRSSRSFALSVELPLPDFLSPNRARGELAATSSTSPTSSPFDFRAAVAKKAAANKASA